MTYSVLDPSYPDDTQGWQICIMEGHGGKGHCPRCGDVNYKLLGYYGALARWGKKWGLTETETERRFMENARARGEDVGE